MSFAAFGFTLSLAPFVEICHSFSRTLYQYPSKFKKRKFVILTKPRGI